ncbi:penicillin-binding protein 1C [Methylomagnum ishizawai]|uniref:peptidoglycan glycosyltransferase n=1 Tax=Methylomagnum ishizawai TaxID=1760988 RepID=A0A1Y6CXX1_9GAMM|nr:penicillin-binding protein 1C [Methylomagnum ishizawai]SMF93403.1 penicillin-binding protein 1C [Methylomagnum ishizawai]
MHIIRKPLVFALGSILLIAALPVGVWLASWTIPVPGFDEIQALWVPSEAYLLDRHGEVIHSLRLDPTVRRLDWTPLADISPALPKAVVVAEDRRFYRHPGVDVVAVAGAVADRMFHGRRRGASTLTMQVAAFLDAGLNRHNGRGIGQKLRQMAAALALERQWSKAQILEAYFNRVGFRGELQGIAATAQGLFGKRPSGLDETESVLLAAFLPAPQADPARLQARARAIAQAGMFHVEHSGLETLASGLLKPKPGLLHELNLAPHLARRFLKKPGERLRTTLDARWQGLVLEALKQQLAGLDGQNVRDAAAVVADNASGEILAYVGSAGDDSRSPGVDGAAARRQAGSTLKPFLYGLAVAQGYLTAASVLEDSPVNLETTTGLYIPQDYDRDFKGPVSVRTALASSLNVPAVRALGLVGVERFRDLLWDLGYAGLTEDGEYYGFSLALGSAEVNLPEQVNAYRSLANGGLWSRLRLLPEASGAEPPRRVLAAGAAFIAADILSDSAGRSLTFGLDSPLSTRYWTAVKTGTSKNMRDNWCIGFSRRYTVGVWVGNFEGDPMRGVSGVTGAAPAWLAIMNGLHAAEPGPPPAAPAGLVARDIRYEPAIEPPRREWFLAGTEAETLHLVEAGTHAPRIESPPRGVVIALDPDIPPRHQRVWFKAKGGAEARFALDGVDLGPARPPWAWLPVPGHHRLELKRGDGAVLDKVEFQVRGPQP